MVCDVATGRPDWLGVRNPGNKPLRVPAGNGLVLSCGHDLRRSFHLVEPEAPWRHQGNGVVDIAARPVRHGLSKCVQEHLAKLPGHVRQWIRSVEPGDEVGIIMFDDPGLAAFDVFPFAHLVVGHTGEEIQVRRGVIAKTEFGHTPRHALRQPSRHGERPGAACGDSQHRELVDPEPVRDECDVLGGVHNPVAVFGSRSLFVYAAAVT
jgi:hypothetical protein